ncbi:MAG: hypothetical protein V4819_08020 [Verrucomicrobiota bacterium]
MKSVVIIIMSLLIFVSCERKANPTGTITPSLPLVTIAEVPSPVQQTITVEKGSNLRAIGATTYGHQRFSGFVAALNGIPDPERVLLGATLKTPSLAAAFRDAGMDPVYQPAMNALAKACTDYYAAEPAYLRARDAAGGAAGFFPIPADIKAKFIHIADTIDSAVVVLEVKNSPYRVPTMTIGQFRQASYQIRELSRGSMDGYGYDFDLVGQRFGLAFTNALIWTQQQHR